jgi:hypothetical protein
VASTAPAPEPGMALGPHARDPVPAGRLHARRRLGQRVRPCETFPETARSSPNRRRGCRYRSTGSHRPCQPFAAIAHARTDAVVARRSARDEHAISHGACRSTCAWLPRSCGPRNSVAGTLRRNRRARWKRNASPASMLSCAGGVRSALGVAAASRAMQQVAISAPALRSRTGVRKRLNRRWRCRVGDRCMLSPAPTRRSPPGPRP